MNRLPAFLALLVPFVAACDSGGPEADLVGTWALTSADTELRVTSRAAQTIPDLTATPSGAVTVSGAVSARLRYVGNIFQFEDFTVLSITEGDPRTGAGLGSELTLQGDGDGTNAYFFPAGDGAFSGYFPGVPSFARSGAQFTVPRLTIEGGDGTVTIGGTLTFPEVRLAASTPTAVRQDPYDAEDGGAAIQFTFEEDGTFRLATTSGNRTTENTGTWETVGAGQVRIGIRENSVTEYVAFDYVVDGGALRLEAAGIDGVSSCEAECLRDVEAQIFAEPRSLTAAESVTVFELQSGAARARASATAGERPGPSWRSAPTVPLLGRTR